MSVSGPLGLLLFCHLLVPFNDRYLLPVAYTLDANVHSFRERIKLMDNASPIR